MDKTLDKTVTQLEAILRQQLDEHEALVGLLQQKRAVLRAAKAQEMSDLTLQENQRVQAISELEKARLKLVGELTLMLDPQAKQPMRMLELAERLPDAMAARVLVLRQQLRKAMERVQQEARVARMATEAVLRHLTGIVQSVGAAATGTTTYSQRGARPKQAAAVSTFSMVA